MKVYVCGGNGWIGQKICWLLKQSVFGSVENNKIKMNDIKISNVSVDDIEEIEEDIKCYNPTHIVCCIGEEDNQTFSCMVGNECTMTFEHTSVGKVICENVRDNLFSPIILALLAQKYNIHLTYIGSGCIFKHNENQCFNESDKPNFFGTSYSVVKGYTDQLMHVFKNVLNLRIRMPITDEMHSRNFITKITTCSYIYSCFNSISVLNDLLPIMIDMMQKKTTGTINFTNPGIISHNEILEMYKSVVDPSFTWKNFNQDEQKILDVDISNNHLDTTLLKTLYPYVSHIKNAIMGILISMRNNKINKNT
jgi:3,5-epimerase/4-reductase